MNISKNSIHLKLLKVWYPIQHQKALETGELDVCYIPVLWVVALATGLVFFAAAGMLLVVLFLIVDSVYLAFHSQYFPLVLSGLLGVLCALMLRKILEEPKTLEEKPNLLYLAFLSWKKKLCFKLKVIP